MAANIPSKNPVHDAGTDPGMVHAFNQGIEPDGQMYHAQDSAAAQGLGSGNPFAFATSRHFFSPVLTAEPENEVLTKIYEMFKGQFVQSGEQHELSIIPIDLTQAPRLVFSVIVIALRDKAFPDRSVAFFTLIIEGSAPDPGPRERYAAGESYLEMFGAADMNDETLDGEVRNSLVRVFPQIPLHCAGVAVVKRDFNPENKVLARRLASRASDACVAELARHAPGGWKDLNLAEAVGSAVLTIRPTFGNDQIYDTMGYPVRGDVEIRTTIPGMPVQGQPEGTVRETTIAVVRGYSDLVWSPADQRGLYGTPWIPPHLVNTQGGYQGARLNYYPRFVITSCMTEKVPTLGGQFVGFISAACLAYDYLWAECFRQLGSRRIGNDTDWRNIGALNIEANFDNNPSGVGVPVDSTLDSFKRQQGPNGSEFHTFIANTIRQQLVVSMDIPECAPETWISELLLLAADHNNTNRRKANQLIIDAAQDFTGDRFLMNYERITRQKEVPLLDRSLVTDEYNRIQLGHFTQNGELLDNRFIDYLAALNYFGPTNHDQVLEWSDTFANTRLPLGLRQARQRKIMEAMVGERNIRYTGHARRCTLESDFLSALMVSIAEAPVKTRIETPVLGQPQYQRSVNQFMASAALDPRIDLGVFGAGPGPSALYGNRTGFNRFMR